jgi:hypothetical protein
MRASEFITEGKRRRKKIRRAAYGPGPYGMYGVDTGYSGDGGGIGESQKKGPAGQLKARDNVDVKGTVLGSPEKSQTGLRNKLVGGAMEENFADGKNPGRKGLAKRSGVNCKASVSTLRNVAKNSSGEKQRMAHWCANMKSGKKK